MLEPLAIEDVTEIVRLLGRLAGSVEPVAVRKRLLIEGLAALVSADVWLWTQGHGQAPETPRAFSMLDGGYVDPSQQAALFRAISHPDWDRLCQQPMTSVDGRPVANPPHLTRTRNQLVPNETWYSSSYYTTIYAGTNLDDYILSVYPLGDGAWSALGFWRTRGREVFSARDRCIVHLIASQVDWLHRQGSEVPAAGRVRSLSPRQHEVLLLLLVGDSRKQIARRMKLSEHTIADYMKALYRHFDVNSRAELMARFRTGDAAAAPGQKRIDPKP